MNILHTAQQERWIEFSQKCRDIKGDPPLYMKEDEEFEELYAQYMKLVEEGKL